MFFWYIFHNKDNYYLFTEFFFVWQGVNDKRSLPTLRILLLIMNLAEYMENLPLEGSSAWATLIPLFEIFFRKLSLMLPENVGICVKEISHSQWC